MNFMVLMVLLIAAVYFLSGALFVLVGISEGWITIERVKDE
jgi:hypothetical protein